jgi:hypothetical protein
VTNRGVLTSLDTHAAFHPLSRTHSDTSVVLPNPAGADTSVRARHAPACNSPVKRTLGIRSGRDLGMNSLVFSSGLDICVIVSRIAIFDAAIIAQRKN